MSSPSTAIRDSRVIDVVGAQNVISDPQSLAAYSVDGVTPQIAARPATAQEVSELVKFAAAENLAVIPTGARTKLGVGMPPARYDLAIDMTRLDRVISYDPGDLTLSVEPGIPLARLARVLAEHNQFLPLDVPFYDRATVGGTLASGVDSPLRQAYGTARDFVLGMEFVSGEGALTKSGGRVVKNVSGYDLHKLFLGSIGSLGIITRVNLKTFPRSQLTQSWIGAFAQLTEAVAFSQQVRQSTLAPYSIDILDELSWIDADVRSSESPAPVEGVFPHSSSARWLVALSAGGSGSILERYSRELWRIAEAAHAHSLVTLTDEQRKWHWKQLCELPQIIVNKHRSATVLKIAIVPSQTGPFISESVALLEALHYMPSALLHASGIAYVFISPHDIIDDGLVKLWGVCQKLFELSAKMNGTVSIPYCPLELKRQLSVWGAPREDFLLQQRLKRAFDPHNIFAPGRFVGGL